MVTKALAEICLTKFWICCDLPQPFRVPQLRNSWLSHLTSTMEGVTLPAGIQLQNRTNWNKTCSWTVFLAGRMQYAELKSVGLCRTSIETFYFDEVMCATISGYSACGAYSYIYCMKCVPTILSHSFTLLSITCTFILLVPAFWTRSFCWNHHDSRVFAVASGARDILIWRAIEDRRDSLILCSSYYCIAGGIVPQIILRLLWHTLMISCPSFSCMMCTSHKTWNIKKWSHYIGILQYLLLAG